MKLMLDRVYLVTMIVCVLKTEHWRAALIGLFISAVIVDIAAALFKAALFKKEPPCKDTIYRNY